MVVPIHFSKTQLILGGEWLNSQGHGFRVCLDLHPELTSHQFTNRGIYHASHSNLNSKYMISRPISTPSYIYTYISDDIPVIERLRAHHADDTQYFTNSIQASGGKRHSAGHCEGPRDWSTRARGGIKAEALRKQFHWPTTAYVNSILPVCFSLSKLWTRLSPQSALGLPYTLLSPSPHKKKENDKISCSSTEMRNCSSKSHVLMVSCYYPHHHPRC